MAVYVTMTRLSVSVFNPVLVCRIICPSKLILNYHSYPYMFIQIFALNEYNLRIVGRRCNLLALTLQETVNGQTPGTTFSSTLFPFTVVSSV